MAGEDRGEDGRGAHVREAFSLLADETRLDIVEYLRHADAPASYAEIKDGIGVRDSGRFNYHLDKLIGTFVTEAESGYYLSFSANTLYQTILSTRPLATHPDIELETDKACPECGSTYDIAYQAEMIASQCPDCDTQGFGYPFPPGGFDDRTDEEVLRAAVQRMYHHISLALHGICPYCSGSMGTTVMTDCDSPFNTSVLVLYTCSLCEMTLHIGPAAMAQQHATVVSLFDEYGLRPTEMLPWEFRVYVSQMEVTVRAMDPYELSLPIEIDDDTYRLDINEREAGINIEVETGS